MLVLLVTRSDDNASIPLVEEALRKRGGTPVRLDTDLYPTEVKISTVMRGDRVDRRLKTPQGEFDLRDVGAVWYRRFVAGGGLPTSLGDLYEPSMQEARRTLWGMIAALPCFQMDPLESVRRTDHKELQLQKAAELGLEIPQTLISNDPAEARKFIQGIPGPVITKMQSSFAVYREGIENVVFTSHVEPEDLEDLEGLKYSPMIFQEAIRKTLDLRVTVVGQEIFAASLDAQGSEKTSLDWRRDGVGLIKAWQPYELPSSLRGPLLDLLSFLGLNYGAVDFVVTPEGRHVFLEVNAVGEFFWLVYHPGLPIPDALADVLLGKKPRLQR